MCMIITTVRLQTYTNFRNFTYINLINNIHSGMVFYQCVSKLLNYTNLCVVTPVSWLQLVQWVIHNVKPFLVMYDSQSVAYSTYHFQSLEQLQLLQYSKLQMADSG